MSTSKSHSRSRVLLALAVLALLASTLVWRLSGNTAAFAASSPSNSSPESIVYSSPNTAPPLGIVAEPTKVALVDLEIPCWSCSKAQEWSVSSRVNLDLIAPLGDGPGNAAEWMLPFVVEGGSRVEELAESSKRSIEVPGLPGSVLPADDPILVEAEQWADQASMKFYPDLLPVQGAQTPIPNLLFSLTLCKSWVARGLLAETTEAALADFRRAVRFGRLLRQEDVTVIADLVGIAGIRYGTQAIFDLAKREGDLDMALAASLVIGELGPQRFLTSAKITAVDTGSEEEDQNTVTTQELDHLIKTAKTDPDRRFRSEAIIEVGFVAHLGSSSQRQRAREVLAELSLEDDPIIAGHASWVASHPPRQN